MNLSATSAGAVYPQRSNSGLIAIVMIEIASYTRISGEMSMSTLPVQRQTRTLMPDFAELLGGAPLFASLRPLFDRNLLRVEDEMNEGRYEVRAEIPGVDPAKDIDVTVHDGLLTIKAVRSQTVESHGRSEFNYGAFARTVPLPSGADVDDVKATYEKGILAISIPMPNGEPATKRIEVQAAE
jgi:HSP20 family protein